MKRNALLIGGFVLAAFAIVVAAILWLSGSDLFSRQQKASVYYQGNVRGLAVGAAVAFRGVTIGQVTGIGIQMDRKSLQTTIPVNLKLHTDALNFSDGAKGPAPDIRSLVQRGLRARLVSESFVTGQKAVELDFAPQTPVVLRGDRDTVEIPALGDRFGALIDQVADLPLREAVDDMRGAVQQLRVTLASLKPVIDDAHTVLAVAGKELQSTAAESRKTLGTASDAIRQLQQHSADTLAAVTRLSDSSRQTVLAAQPELQRALVGAREAAESAKLAMGRVSDIAAPGAPMRSDLEAAVKDLSQAARGLRSLSELLEEKPNAIVFGNRRQ